MSIKDVKAKVHLKGSHEGLEKVEGLLEGIKHRLEFLTAVELGHKLFELTEKFAHFGEELHLAADSAGVTVERLQALGYAAAQSAISQEELGLSLRVLARSLNAARTEGGSAAKAFKDAGIDMDQVRSFKTADQALLVLADRFNKIQDPIKKSALQQELLGRGSQKMVGFLSQGSGAIRGMTKEAEDLNLILSHHQVMALKDAESAIGRLSAMFKAISGTIAAEVAPLVEHVTGEIMEFVKANRQLIQVNIENWLLSTAYTMGFIWGVVQVGIGLFQKLSEVLGYDGAHMLTFASKAVGIISTLLIVGKVLSMVGGSLAALRTYFLLSRAAMFAFSEGAVGLMITLATKATPALFAAGEAIGSFLALGAGPIALIAAAIAGLVIGIHDIYALLTGQPTWLGQFWDWLKSLEAIKSAVAWITQTWDAFSSKASGIMDKVKGFFGGGPSVDVSQKFAQFAGGPGAPVPLGAPPSAGNTTSVTSTVQAPVTIVVPPGTPQDQVGQHVQAGVADHMDRVMRQTARSTRNAVAY